MPTTSNFGWTTPADTDLVKDGAAAIRTLGNGIDTSFIDLKGGTTGQILAKASNTDLDFSWIANDQGDITEVAAGTGISGGGTSGSVTITNSMATAIDAKGDLIAGTGADTFARLAVGTNNQVLTADSSTSTGLTWTTPVTGSLTLLSTTTASGASTTVSSISGSYTHLYIVIDGITSSATMTIRFSTNNSTNVLSYYRIDAGGIGRVFLSSHIDLDDGAQQPLNTSTKNVYSFLIQNYSSTSIQKVFSGIANYEGTASNGRLIPYYGGIAATTAVDSITIQPSSAGPTFSGGTIKIYGVK